MDPRQTERDYTDDVIGETTIPELILESVDRNAGRDAQMYKGGVYDRSLAGDVVPEPPAGEYGAITYREMAPYSPAGGSGTTSPASDRS